MYECVTGLAQVQLLLEAEQVEVRSHPAARRPLDVEVGSLLHREFVGLRVERAEPARCALRMHDPDDLAAARIVVVQAGVQHHLFHRRGHALGAAVPDVVQQRLDGAAGWRGSSRIRAKSHQ